MLSIRDNHLSRRSFMQVGGLALGGLTLPQVMAATGEEDPWKLFKGKTVIFVFQHGGPSQYETYDPKMTAPSSIHSMTGEIPTSLPGVCLLYTSPSPRDATLSRMPWSA